MRVLRCMQQLAVAVYNHLTRVGYEAARRSRRAAVAAVPPAEPTPPVRLRPAQSPLAV